MQLIDEKLDLELCASLWGWHEFEQKAGGIEIIDMNLSDKIEPKAYQYRYEVLKDIEGFLDLPEVKNHAIISRKLTTHKYFILKLMGAIIPFDEYLENTMGTKPVLYSDKKIQTIKEQTNELLKQNGLLLGEGARNALNRKDKAVPEQGFIALFNDHHRRLYERVKETTGIDVDFSINYQQINEDIPTIAEIRGDGKIYDVKFNMHHMKHDAATALGHLSSHEITAHGVQFAELRRQADNGEVPRYVTLITIPEQIHYSSEGLAESLRYFYPEMYPDDTLTDALYSLDRLRRVVGNNAGVMANRGEKFQDCVQYMYENNPVDPINYTAHRLGAFTKGPVESSYNMIYSQAMECFIEISQSHANKYQFLHGVYSGFKMPDEIQAQVKRPIIDFV